MTETELLKERVLNQINLIRAIFGLPALPQLEPGLPKQPDACPIKRSLPPVKRVDHTVMFFTGIKTWAEISTIAHLLKRRWGWSPFGGLYLKTTEEMMSFINLFDDKKIPELIDGRVTTATEESSAVEDTPEEPELVLTLGDLELTEEPLVPA